jgi:serine/threonine protein kinase
LLYGRLPKGKNDCIGLDKDKKSSGINEVIAKCMKNNPEDRYQRVEDLQRELQLVKNMLVVTKARHRFVLRLEITIAVVLSIISYVITVLGIVGTQP